MEIKLKENRWLILAWSSLAVVGSYVLLDLYNKNRLKTQRFNLRKLKQEDDRSESSSSYGTFANFTINYLN